MTRQYRAREVSGDEKALWWRRAVDAFPDFADYQLKTARQIPVFVFEPVSGGAALPPFEAGTVTPATAASTWTAARCSGCGSPRTGTS